MIFIFYEIYSFDCYKIIKIQRHNKTKEGDSKEVAEQVFDADGGELAIAVRGR